MKKIKLTLDEYKALLKKEATLEMLDCICKDSETSESFIMSRIVRAVFRDCDTEVQEDA